jgi:DNA-binding NtrC family response regulator
MMPFSTARDDMSVALGNSRIATLFPPLDLVFGKSPSMQQVSQAFRHAVVFEEPVLIQGETGTGKHLFANLLHATSQRKELAFVRVNCAATSGTLFKAELTGALTEPHCSICRPVAALTQARLGFVMLEGVESLDQLAQSCLLDFIRHERFSSSRGHTPDLSAPRLLATSNQDLTTLAARGQFDPRLLSCLREVTIALPPLRNRLEDLKDLVPYLLKEYTDKVGSPVQPFSTKAWQALYAHHWPGNLRELRNVIRRSILLRNEEDLLATIPQRRATDRRLPTPGPLSMSVNAPTMEASLPSPTGDKTLVLHRQRRPCRSGFAISRRPPLSHPYV